ncbi:MAG: response regulator [Bdellovibrionaceae bacterium]|nr:response regulator [Pseudobdellovibrionaceae bacterium]MBX3032569.1 response regulator [Pseudobdellovibrionaceae bacterium]
MKRERWYILLAGAGLATLIGVGFITSFATVRYNEAVHWQHHSSAVLTEVREVQMALLEAENVHRRPPHVQDRRPASEGRARLLERMDRLSALVGNEASQSVAARRVNQLLLSLGDENHFLRSPDSRETSLSAHAHLAAMRAYEMELLKQRSAARDDEFSRTISLVLVSSMVAFVLLLSSGVFMMTELRLRRRRENHLQDAQSKALEASKTKSMFLARMSHEIRTPMNGILGMAELLQRTPMTPLQLKNIGIIHQSATSLLALINDILDLSKVESGRLEIDAADFQLSRLLGEISESMAYAAGAKKLRLEFNNQVPENMAFRGDPFRIRQVLVNLIGNAVKFSEKGLITVRASKTVSGELQFEVSDQGPGIPSDVVKRLFSPFTQGSLATTHAFGGTGLGLSISKELVQLMGGRIGVDSEPGRGSTFWFRLPLPSAKDIVYGSATDLSVTSKTARQLRILVAEDNEINRLVMAGMLEKLGHVYEMAENGQIALDKLAAGEHYDLILMDCHMPVLDGYQTVTRIRESEGSSVKEIPIIAVSASAIKGEKERCLEIGMNDYLSKPLLLNDLSAKISQWAA